MSCRNKRNYLFLILLILVLCFSQMGCTAIGQVIGGTAKGFGAIIGGVFKLVGKTLDFISKMPKPPPGAF